MASSRMDITRLSPTIFFISPTFSFSATDGQWPDSLEPRHISLNFKAVRLVFNSDILSRILSACPFHWLFTSRHTSSFSRARNALYSPLNSKRFVTDPDRLDGVSVTVCQTKISSDWFWRNDIYLLRSWLCYSAVILKLPLSLLPPFNDSFSTDILDIWSWASKHCYGCRRANVRGWWMARHPY